MGHAIYYCSGCSKQLRDPDFEKAAAFRAEGRVFCKDCAPANIRAQAPPPPERKHDPVGPGSTRSIPIVRAEGAAPPKALVLAAAVLVGLLLIAAVALMTRESPRAVHSARSTEPAPAPTPAPTPPPPTPAPVPRDERPAEEALRKAREFARSRPDDLAGQIALFDAAVLASEGTGHHATAVRERDAVMNRLKPDVKNGLEALDEAVRQASARDELGMGLKLLEDARTRPLGSEWTAEVDRRTKSFEDGIQTTFSTVVHGAVDARQRGDEAAVKRHMDRVEKWQIERYTAELAKTLAATTAKPKPPPSKPATPALPKGLDAYRKRWAEAVAIAPARDAAALLKKIEEARAGATDPAVQAEAAVDLESVKLAMAVEEEGLQALAKTPKGQKVTLIHMSETGLVEVSGTLTRVDAQEIQIAREKDSVRIPAGEVSARTLAQLARPKREGKGLALLCLLERDVEGARSFAEGDGGIPDKYWTYAAGKDLPAEVEARRTYWSADRDAAIHSRAGVAAQKFAALLKERAETAFVRRNQALISARQETPREFFFLFDDLRAAGAFRAFKGEKDEVYWKSLTDIDSTRMAENYVELSFAALADTEYRCWFYIGGCCTESVTCYSQIGEGAEPVAEATTPVRHLPSMQYKTHEAHEGRGRPVPRFGWVPVSLPKFTTAGPKRVRLVTAAKNFCVAEALVSATRPGVPPMAELAQLERARLEQRGSARLDPALVGHWKFADGSGAVAADSSASGLDAKLGKGVTWAPGTASPWSPRALKLDGSGCVTLGSQLSIVQNVPACTLAAWICPDKLSDQTNSIIAISRNNGTTPTLESRVTMNVVNSGLLQAGARANDTPGNASAVKTPDRVIKAGVWTHVAAVIDYPASTITLYVNGAPVTAAGTVKLGAKATANTPSTCGAIGGDDDGSKNFFSGRLADVRVYARALTREEVAELAVPGATPR